MTLFAGDPLRPWRSRFTFHKSELLLRSLPALIYLALIYYLSDIPATNIPPVVDDRIAHFVEYFFLSPALMLFAAGTTTYHVQVRHFVASWAFAFLYAVSDEIHQMFVPGREASFKDILFDVLGSGIALSMLRLVLQPGRRYR